MSPVLAALDGPDHVLTHVEESADLRLGQSTLKQLPDLTHAILGQLGGSAPFSATRSSVSDPISLVFDFGSPNKIADVVVAGIPVKVTALLSDGTRANKGFKHESMNVHPSAASFGVETDLKILASVAAQFANAPDKRTPVRSDTFHVSPVGHLVGFFVVDNRLPVFSVDSGSGGDYVHGQSVSKSARKSSQRIARSFPFVVAAARAVKSVLAVIQSIGFYNQPARGATS